jgi:glycerol uptake facilitator-like aquaporin
MLFRRIGKWLFPRAHPWEQKKKVQTMFFVVLVALVAAGCLGLMIYKHAR